MSIVAQGMSRLCCVCRCRSGLRSAFSPLIHILDGENVWHQVISPMHPAEALASWQSAAAASGVFTTPLHTTLTGMPAALSSAPTISFALDATFFSVSGPVESLAAGDKPDVELLEINHIA